MWPKKVFGLSEFKNVENLRITFKVQCILNQISTIGVKWVVGRVSSEKGKSFRENFAFFAENFALCKKVFLQNFASISLFFAKVFLLETLIWPSKSFPCLKYQRSTTLGSKDQSLWQSLISVEKVFPFSFSQTLKTNCYWSLILKYLNFLTSAANYTPNPRLSRYFMYLVMIE